MQTDQLIPRLPRRKKQPTADQMREQLATRSPQPAKTYSFDKILDDLGPEHRANVEKRFKELLADYNSQEPVSSPKQQEDWCNVARAGLTAALESDNG